MYKNAYLRDFDLSPKHHGEAEGLIALPRGREGRGPRKAIRLLRHLPAAVETDTP